MDGEATVLVNVVPEGSAGPVVGVTVVPHGVDENAAGPQCPADLLRRIAEWQPYFQVRTLTAYVRTLRGTFHYVKPFDGV